MQKLAFVPLLQNHFPYHESDHVLNIAYNAMTDGTCLEDLKRKRAAEAYLNALGAQRIPDASTAGDFVAASKTTTTLTACTQPLMKLAATCGHSSRTQSSHRPPSIWTDRS